MEWSKEWSKEFWKKETHLFSQGWKTANQSVSRLTHHEDNVLCCTSNEKRLTVIPERDTQFPSTLI